MTQDSKKYRIAVKNQLITFFINHAQPFHDILTTSVHKLCRQHLRFATQRKLAVPRYRLNSFGRRRFSVAGPSTWNSLPDSLRDPELSLDTFKRQLKTYIFAKCWWQNVLSALEIFLSMRYINLHFSYYTHWRRGLGSCSFPTVSSSGWDYMHAYYCRKNSTTKYGILGSKFCIFFTFSRSKTISGREKVIAFSAETTPLILRNAAGCRERMVECRKTNSTPKSS